MASQRDGKDTRGYFATLGVTFRSEEDEINRKYKKLALKMHPDKNKAEDAVDVFQQITTSYHTVSDPEKRKNYMELYRLRCYMCQEPPHPEGLLRPYYAFAVEKSKNRGGPKQMRMLIFDLFDFKMYNCKKDVTQKEYGLHELQSVHEGGNLELSIQFKTNHPYYIKAQTKDQFETLRIVLRRICEAAEISTEDIGVEQDDEDPPASSKYKSKCLKKAGPMAEQQPRFMVLGTTHLLLFRSNDLQQMVNMFPVSVLKPTSAGRNSPNFNLSTANWKAAFTVLNPEVAREWFEAFSEQKKLLQENLPAAKKGARPSVIFSEGDLANAQNPLRKPKGPGLAGLASMPSVPSFYSRKTESTVGLQEEVKPLRALKAPVLAEPERHMADNWLEYHDDYGRPYYYNSVTNETAWYLPSSSSQRSPHRERCDDSTSPSPSFDPRSRFDTGSSTRDMSEKEERDDEQTADERERAAAALRSLAEQERSAAAALAEAKAGLGLGLNAIDRKIHKFKKSFEGDRGVADLAALWQQLRIVFDEASNHMAAFQQAAAAQEEQQRDYMQRNGNYLNGLQSHMLGGERKEDAGLASSIFKKCAYVADTLARNKHVAL